MRSKRAGLSDHGISSFSRLSKTKVANFGAPNRPVRAW
jgi:hypothetical protein